MIKQNYLQTNFLPKYQIITRGHLTNEKLFNNLIERIIFIYRNLILFTKNYLIHDRRYSVKNSKVHDFLDWNQVTSYNDSFKKTEEWYV